MAHMGDLKIFRITEGRANEISGSAVDLERRLQRLIESNMETLVGVTFLASEYSTGHKHRGRIDSIGLDENGSPVIIEYKRSRGENVVNQGLFYLDWLLDHKAEFEMLAMQKAPTASRSIDWSNPRLICIASDFNRYDEHAVQQIDRSIDLIRYQDFNGELLSLELITATTHSMAVPAVDRDSDDSYKARQPQVTKTVRQYLDQAREPLQELYKDLDSLILALGDDVQMTERQNYFAYKRLKNFVCVEVKPQSEALLLYVKVDPDTVELSDGFTRDVRRIGHFGTGDLEIRITNAEQLAMAEPLITLSYANS